MMRPAALLLTAALALGACAAADPEVDLLGASYKAADTLIADSGDRIARDSPILYATFLPVGHLESPTPLGQILAEQTASRFVQRGFPVVEVRLREQVAVMPGGPYVLSDNAREVAERVFAKAALVGSYAATDDYVLLNVRIIDVATGVVVASYDARIPMGANEQALIDDQALIYDRIWRR